MSNALHSSHLRRSIALNARSPQQSCLGPPLHSPQVSLTSHASLFCVWHVFNNFRTDHESRNSKIKILFIFIFCHLLVNQERLGLILLTSQNCISNLCPNFSLSAPLIVLWYLDDWCPIIHRCHSCMKLRNSEHTVSRSAWLHQLVAA